jgi:3-dehydro-L-gulonate 2-dehydrogenase
MSDGQKRRESVMIRIPANDLQKEFERVLISLGFSPERARLCAEIFTENTLTGVNSHGINWVPKFADRVRQGYIDPQARPEKIDGFGAWERWDGRYGPGPLNAVVCTDRAMTLARDHGMGCVALRNTTHWLRAGTYGWRAAEAGFIFMCWTNTLPLMPPWGGKTVAIGNNPMVLAVPRQNGPVVLDMAMSQFSIGRLTTTKDRNDTLPVPGGYDKKGNLTDDPGEILETRRPLPIGYWKGSGLALLLDLISTLLADGRSTHQIRKKKGEHGASQTYIAFNIMKTGDSSVIHEMVDRIVEEFLGTAPVDDRTQVLYPGQRALRTREENLEKGVPVDPAVWEQVQAL